MKKCYTELMKDLKEIQDEIKTIQSSEFQDSVVEYSQDEERIPSSYNYEDTRYKIKELQEKEREIKTILTKKNFETVVEDYHMSIAEAIVYLGELLSNKSHLQALCNRKQITRKTSSYTDRVNYVETLYDVNKCKEDYKNICKEITRLQMAIDRTNLNNFVDIN